MGGDPRTPEGLNAGLAAADEQNPGQVDQICETCPDNWVETGAIDESTGEPLPNLPYRIFEIATKDEVARGVLDANGRSPRHQIPMPATQLFVMFGTDEAIDEAMEQMEALQRERDLQENARPDWRGMPAGLDEEGFNAAYDQRAIENGRPDRPNAGFFKAAGYGAKMAYDYVSSGFDYDEMGRRLYEDDRRRSFEQYQLVTNGREASRGESLASGSGQGLTFGFGDEAAAGIQSLFDPRSYQEIVEERRQILRHAQISNPGHYLGGEIAGAVPTIFIPVGGAAAAAARGGTRAAMASGARTGAGLGAVSGAGHDEGGIVDRLDGAAVGAVTGGVGGAVLSGAGVLIARGVSRTRIWARAPKGRSLISEARAQHILHGDRTGGGHLWPGASGKSPFPKNWSENKILNEINTIASDASIPGRIQGNGRILKEATVDGINVRVVIDPPSRGGGVVTGFPTNVPRNPK